MGRADVIADGIGALIRLFRGRPDIVIPRRVPTPVRPRPDPEPAPPLPPVPHRPPYIPRLRDPDAETQPEGQTEGETTTTTEDMQECENCPDCEPRKQGHAQFRTLTGTEESKINVATYQNWVIPWLRWIGNEQEEWRFSGVWYDGIDPSACQLIETKAKFRSFFSKPRRHPRGTI
jgi:Restriction endonuclease fold toxin 5